jgi:RNA polymerase subunit RPABC4/transcription elongation factor Spt4
MACPGCNRRIEEDFMVCPTCHTRLKKACPACGRLLHLRWNICPFCGAVQTTAKAAPALSAQPVPMPVEAGVEAPGLPEPAPAASPEPVWEEQAGQGREEPAETTVQEQIGPEQDELAGPVDEGEPELPDETNAAAADETAALPFEFS